MSELADFVLNYQVNGALLESPGYGVYEALLPETLAAPLDAPVFQQFVFDPPEAISGDRLHLTIGHPLVDRMVDLARQSPAPAHAYINAVRLDKHGLATLARQALAFPNARLVEAPRQASDSLDSLRRRTARYLELDRARLEQYYDDITRDLERRPALQDKPASVQAERNSNWPTPRRVTNCAWTWNWLRQK